MDGANFLFMVGGFRLTRVFGVEIHVDWSLLAILALVAADLGVGILPSWHPEWGPALRWSVAAAAAVALIVSVLLHELAHAAVAKAYGIPVPRITLFLFGGLAQIDREPSSPSSEFLIAVAGPAASVAIGLAASFAALSLGGPGLQAAVADENAVTISRAAGSIGPLITLLLWLGPINVLLGVFNMLPGFPLDGGRVFRSIVWRVTGDMLRATHWASIAGQIVAWGLMAIGVANVLSGFASGFWLLLIGWFLNQSARAAWHEAVLRHAARHATVGQVMTPASAFTMLPPDADVERALEQLDRRHQDQILVLDGHQLLGLVRRRDLVNWQAATAREGGHS
jgi:Zn-dependent protease